MSSRSMLVAVLWTGVLLLLENHLASAGQPDGSKDAHARREFQQFKEILARQDLTALRRIQRINRSRYETWNQKQRDEIALILAQNLKIRSLLESLEDQQWREIRSSQQWSQFVGKQPQDGPVRIRWGINAAAAGTLNYLARKRLITEPRVIPYLIEALEHPDQGSIRRDAFGALSHLTRHSTGLHYFSFSRRDPEKDRQLIGWWKRWWEANQDKHPVFEPALEQEARSEVLRLARTIEQELKPRYRDELRYFRTPEKPLGFGYPHLLFHLEYNPRMLAWHIPAVNNPPPPWLLILCRFGTEEPKAPDPRPEVPKPPKELEHLVKTVYARELDGTDVLVTVSVASSNKGLANDLEKTLDGSSTQK